ncbi:MAG TPA: FAD-dependent thymidylate synthase, partial [Verrucomicrobiae bacterium]|nr:FAD-dependent thymidylate synthase [Verrucomicrobiae bacterium]
METRRPTNPAAEELLGLYFPVLDHGFVALVDYMGSDEDVERAARVSYGYGTRRTSETRGLIRYLRRHRHTTPSEMVELKFHCAMPIFVALVDYMGSDEDVERAARVSYGYGTRRTSETRGLIRYLRR